MKTIEKIQTFGYRMNNDWIQEIIEKLNELIEAHNELVTQLKK